MANWEGKELLAVAHAYRDRADTENMFDELKNQWGWTGFSTGDLQRSQLMARIVALIHNWWSLFMRLANQDQQWGGHHDAAAISAEDRPPYTPRTTEPFEFVEPPCHGTQSGELTVGDQRLAACLSR